MLDGLEASLGAEEEPAPGRRRGISPARLPPPSSSRASESPSAAAISADPPRCSPPHHVIGASASQVGEALDPDRLEPGTTRGPHNGTARIFFLSAALITTSRTSAAEA